MDLKESEKPSLTPDAPEQFTLHVHANGDGAAAIKASTEIVQKLKEAGFTIRSARVELHGKTVEDVTPKEDDAREVGK